MPAELKIIGNSEDAIAAVTKLERKLDLLENKIRQQAKANRDAANASKSFSNQMILGLTQVATGWMSVSTAIGLATNAQQKFNAEKNKRADELKSDFFAIGELAQFAKTPAEFKKLSDAAHDMFKTGGAKSVAEGATVVSSLAGADMMQDLPLFTKMRQTGFAEDIAPLATAVKTLVTAMGAKETGNSVDILSKGFEAANVFSGNPIELISAVARSAVSGKALGLSDEELFAATTVVANAKGSAEIGGTLTDSLLRSLTEKQVEGKTLQEKLGNVKAMGMSDPELQQFFGRAEAMQAYRLLTDEENKPTYDKLVKDVGVAQANKTILNQVGLPMTDPRMQAAAGEQVAVAQNVMAQKEEGKDLARSLMRRVETERDTNVIRDKDGFLEGFQRTLNYVGNRVMEFVSDDERRLKDVLVTEEQRKKEGLTPTHSEELLTQIRDALHVLNGTAEKQIQQPQHNRKALE